MKIKKYVGIIDRRDFEAIYVCEGCGAEEKKCGYDDSNFHENVIPNMECEACGKSRKDLGLKGITSQARFDDSVKI